MLGMRLGNRQSAIPSQIDHHKQARRGL
jgi:hypothetical protein